MTNELTIDRRSGVDRRVRQDRYSGPERRSGHDRRHTGMAVAANALRRHDTAAAAATTKPIGNFRATGLGHPFGTTELLERVGGTLTDLVASFYEASMDNRLWPDTLTKLRAAVHADACAIVNHDFVTGRGQLEHSVNIQSIYVTAYADYYGAYNPWMHNRETLGEQGQVRIGQDLVADNEVIESDFYRFWLRPQQLFHHMFGVIETAPDSALLIVFSRASEIGAFRPEDADLLRRLLPTLQRGIHAGRAYQHTRHVQRTALDTLDAMPIAVMMMNNGGGMLSANRSARELLDGSDPFFLQGGLLSLKLPTGAIRLRDYLESVAQVKPYDRTGDLLALPVPRPGSSRPLTMIIAPVKDLSIERRQDEPAAVIFVADPERPVEMDPKRLIRLYGLSRAEARVAALLGQGMRLEEVGQALGLTYETVRKHLKQIFAKTATDRQAELVRTLSLGPAGLRI
ncbi:MAG: helix-turn-helix transcriptional regulator [Rhodospirillales bacterium]|jgi:DNA-binding CsgD family transcriptional regulator|nr:helix-turn-helix transcriptional regulator [Rhodospirillales bacterium]